MKVIHNLKGGSLSRTSVVMDGKDKFVRKYILIDTDREYGLVRWQSQPRKMQLLRNFCHQILCRLLMRVDERSISQICLI